MKTAFKVIALIFVLGFVSCTDNDNIVPENEKQQIQAIDKGSDIHVGGVDDEEDNNDL
ncbi:hypothetical protein [Tenacibaculum sp. Bg11-29]|uniref:hypothetical protein n=1 Tax=Tenacibaculum sp. Bg11-29 TaxID=2058306 RepID=UPI0012FEB37E|nr:hypothetical protein [Tenacibaculum sp. Bg11-29]